MGGCDQRVDDQQHEPHQGCCVPRRMRGVSPFPEKAENFGASPTPPGEGRGVPHGDFSMGGREEKNAFRPRRTLTARSTVAEAPNSVVCAARKVGSSKKVSLC